MRPLGSDAIRSSEKLGLGLTRRTSHRFVDCEAWRKETNLDDVVPSWEYPEKRDIFKYYPQYYHKTDKVGEVPQTRFGRRPRLTHW